MFLLIRLPQPRCCNSLVMLRAACSIVWLNPGLESWSDAEKPRAPLIPSTRRLLATSLARRPTQRREESTRFDFRKWFGSSFEDHGSITPRECRELFGLGDSQAAMPK